MITRKPAILAKVIQRQNSKYATVIEIKFNTTEFCTKGMSYIV